MANKNRNEFRAEEQEAVIKADDVSTSEVAEVEALEAARAFPEPLDRVFTGEDIKTFTDSSGEPPTDLVHDVQGNVRAIFTNEGVGEVTQADAERVLGRIREEGQYVIKGRAVTEGGDQVYDVYRRKVLIIAGAKLEDLSKLYQAE